LNTAGERRKEKGKSGKTFFLSRRTRRNAKEGEKHLRIKIKKGETGERRREKGKSKNERRKAKDWMANETC